MPVSALRSYYQEASNRYGVDPSYLASINFIESNFGRINGPSSAGAQGPMQFLPEHMDRVRAGREHQRPHDSILAAARYLAHNGAPYNMRNAIYHYNLDYDYVERWSPSRAPTAPTRDGSTACTTGTPTAISSRRRAHWARSWILRYHTRIRHHKKDQLKPGTTYGWTATRSRECTRDLRAARRWQGGRDQGTRQPGSPSLIGV